MMVTRYSAIRCIAGRRPTSGPGSASLCRTRPGRLPGRLLVGLALLALGGGPLSAQQQLADGAWNQGRYEEAQAAYRLVLAQDPNAVRANLRLGVMLSWREQFDSALGLVARARAAEPADAELRLIEARILALAGRHRLAIAQYDSLLQKQPDSRDAALGRARVLAWSGRLAEAVASYDSIVVRHPSDEEAMLGGAQASAWRGDLQNAERRYRAVIERSPTNTEAVVGLGYVFHWQGRSRAADRQARSALTVDSTYRPARELRQAVRVASRSSVETSTAWSNDSDDNSNWSQTVAAAVPVAEGMRAFGSVNALQAGDPVRDATRLGGEAGVTWVVDRFQLTGAAGARTLDAQAAGTRTAATYRGRATYRPVPTLGLGLGYSRAPFDETALLIERGLDLESLEGSADLALTPWLRASAGGGRTWLSDGNNRSSAVAGLTGTLRRRFSVGAFARTLSYDRRGTGYFSPDRFSLLEAIGGYSLERGKWDGRVSGGLGAQQIGAGGAAQSEWHVETRLGRRWGLGNRVELFGLVTNSAVSSTSGAFRYRSAGLAVTLGL
jgi:tetratricopeptide (TPR) repeat protein